MKEIWKVRVLRAKHGTNVKDSVGQTRFSGVYKRNLVNPAFFYFENVDLVDWYPFWKLKIKNWKIEKLKNWKIENQWGFGNKPRKNQGKIYTRARARASLSWASLSDSATRRLWDEETKSFGAKSYLHTPRWRILLVEYVWANGSERAKKFWHFSVKCSDLVASG